MTKIRLALVDDSIFVRNSVARLFVDHDQIDLVGVASCGEELFENWSRWQPEVILLDLFMPGMGGMQTLDRIVANYRARVILFSTHSSKDAAITLEALDRGAADYIDKQQFSLADFERLRSALIDKICAVTGHKIDSPRSLALEHRRAKQIAPTEVAVPEVTKRIATVPFLPDSFQCRLVVLGASTGGPPALRKVLADLGSEISVPVAVVQHMGNPFLETFAQRLNDHVSARVCLASHGEELLPGYVYLAPADFHFKIKAEEEKIFAVLSEEPTDLIHCPSVDMLFASAAEALGSSVTAALLTGMGRDGAQGMRKLAEAGAYTIAQNAETCVVYGMPRAAVELQAAKEVLPLDAIGARIQNLMQESRNSREAPRS